MSKNHPILLSFWKFLNKAEGGLAMRTGPTQANSSSRPHSSRRPRLSSTVRGSTLWLKSRSTGFTSEMLRICLSGGRLFGNKLAKMELCRHIWDVKAALLEGTQTSDQQITEHTLVVQFQSPVSYSQNMFEKQVEQYKYFDL